MYINHNLNPKNKKTTDCSIRAVAAATGLSWDETYECLCRIGFELKTPPCDVETVDKLLLQRGFQVGKIKIVKGSKRPTVRQFATEHPDWYCVLRVAGHLVATGKGNYVDIWDSGDCAVYKYWFKPV